MAFSIDFMGQRRLATALSVALILLSVVVVAGRGLSFGLDFTGGTLVEVSYPKPVAAAQVRDWLQADGFLDASVQQSGSEREMLVRVPVRAEVEAFQLGDRIAAALAAHQPGVEVKRAEFVGPAVGEDLRESGGLALLLSLAVIGVYIAWRFTGKFSVAATIALIHDVVITVGAFALFRWRFDLPSLAALLTVIGYSLNDTIVVCDRIRENLRTLRRSSLTEVINLSLNQTLERTLIMSGTTLAVLFSLLIFGGEGLRGFSLALTLGVVVGTYSSIYVAAAYLVFSRLSAADLIVETEPEPQP